MNHSLTPSVLFCSLLYTECSLHAESIQKIVNEVLEISNLNYCSPKNANYHMRQSCVGLERNIREAKYPQNMYLPLNESTGPRYVTQIQIIKELHVLGFFRLSLYTLACFVIEVCTV